LNEQQELPLPPSVRRLQDAPDETEGEIVDETTEDPSEDPIEDPTEDPPAEEVVYMSPESIVLSLSSLTRTLTPYKPELSMTLQSELQSKYLYEDEVEVLMGEQFEEVRKVEDQGEKDTLRGWFTALLVIGIILLAVVIGLVLRMFCCFA